MFRYNFNDIIIIPKMSILIDLYSIKPISGSCISFKENTSFWTENKKVTQAIGDGYKNPFDISIIGNNSV